MEKILKDYPVWIGFFRGTAMIRPSLSLFAASLLGLGLLQAQDENPTPPAPPTPPPSETAPGSAPEPSAAPGQMPVPERMERPGFMGGPGRMGPPPGLMGPPGPSEEGGSGGVMLQFPLNGVSDILSVYERLTQRTVLRDTSIFEGPQVSLVTAMEVPRDEAIRLIEATLTLNGYVIVDEGDRKTLKVLLGRAADQPAGGVNGGASVFTDAAALPPGDLLVSFFLGLEFLAPDAAAVLMSNHVQMNAYGRITPVETPSGLLITESAGIVRQLVRLKELIDVPPGESKLMTQFVKLEFADANTVAQIIQATMDARYEEKQRLEEQGRSMASARGAQTENRQPQSSSSENRSPSPKPSDARKGNKGTPLGSILGTTSEPSAQLVADDRLNRIFVQASPADFAFILDLIHDFDQPLPEEEPLECPLNYVKVVDVLPVIVDVLTDKGSGTTQLPGGRSLETRQAVASSTSLASLSGVRTQQQQQQQQRFQQQTGEEEGSRPDRLAFPVDDVAPVSVLVGKTRLIADRQTNALLVIGSREAKGTVFNLLQKLDRKPPQVYLAVVIGQLELGNGLDFGTEWPEIVMSGRGWSEAYDSGKGRILGGPGIENKQTVSDPMDLQNLLLSNVVGKVNGLNLYGTVGMQLDILINALETTNRFKVLSRPVLSVQNNKRASITNGKRIPVPAATITDATSGTRNAALSTTITFENVVLKLEVIPQINENDEVTLEIAQVNDTEVGEETVANNTVPVIGTQELTTTVTVPNRQTIVLGGLITEELNHKTTGVPFVSKIPLVGQAFKDTEREMARRELLIFIQPVVVRNQGDLANASFDEDLRTEVAADAADAFPAPGEATRNFEESLANGPADASGPAAAKKPLLQRLFPNGGTGPSSTLPQTSSRRKGFKAPSR